jgi:hypothetical protein
MMTFAEFESDAMARGYHEVLERRWQPDTVLDTHGHAFEARALVTEGEMWLTQGGDTRHLLPGDTFLVTKDEPHAERYGRGGAVYWVARRNG